MKILNLFTFYFSVLLLYPRINGSYDESNFPTQLDNRSFFNLVSSLSENNHLNQSRNERKMIIYKASSIEAPKLWEYFRTDNYLRDPGILG